MSFKKFILCLMILGYINSKLACKKTKVCKSELTLEYYCNSESGFCEHESLAKMRVNYIIGLVILVINSAFSNAGGIGGGSINVPLLTSLFLYEVNEAIPLSKGTIFAGAIINVVFMLHLRKEENENETLIDYRLCAFILPTMMCGTFYGVYFNFVIPPLIIILMLTVFLVISIHKMYQKYKLLTDKEDREIGISLWEQIKVKWNEKFPKKKKVPKELENGNEGTGQDQDQDSNLFEMNELEGSEQNLLLEGKPNSDDKTLETSNAKVTPIF